MKASGITSSSARAWFSAGAPILALVLLCMALGLTGLWAFARAQDTDFAEHARQLVQSAAHAQQEALENLTLDYANWNEAYEHTTLQWDEDWVASNYYSSIADAVMIVRSDGAVRHAWFAEGLEGEAAALSEALVAAVQRDLNLGALLSASGHDGMTASTTASLGADLVLISIAPISPEAQTVRTTRDPDRPIDYVAILEHVTAEDLGMLGSRLHIDGLRFAQQTHSGEQGVAITGASGSQTGMLVWRRQSPGATAFARNAAAIVLVLCITGWISLLLAVRLVSSHMRSEARLGLAVEASRVKSEFISTMSHELRTPLNAIVGYAGLIQEEAGDLGMAGEAIEEDAGRVLSAAQHLSRLINDVLDQSRIDAGRLNVTCEPVEAAAATAEVEEALRPLAQASGNRFSVIVAADVGQALADPLRLHQCLVNLAANALKFTCKGEVVISVRRVLDHASERVSFEVSDTGIGISREELKLLFKPFSQANRAVTQKFGGTGLGLSISRKLARAMGGDILVDSELGRGSVFTLLLPAAPVESPIMSGRLEAVA
jgi:signal transduction histidine kinase